MLLLRQYTGPVDRSIDRTMIIIHLLLPLAPGLSVAFVTTIVFIALVSWVSVTLEVLSTITLVSGVLASCLVRSSFVSEKITDGSDQLLNRMALQDLQHGVTASVAVVMMVPAIEHIFCADSIETMVQC